MTDLKDAACHLFEEASMTTLMTRRRFAGTLGTAVAGAALLDTPLTGSSAPASVLPALPGDPVWLNANPARANT